MFWGNHDDTVTGNGSHDLRICVSRSSQPVRKYHYWPSLVCCGGLKERGVFPYGDRNVVEEARKISAPQSVFASNGTKGYTYEMNSARVEPAPRNLV
jgi:hypothetical protein